MAAVQYYKKADDREDKIKKALTASQKDTNLTTEALQQFQFGAEAPTIWTTERFEAFLPSEGVLVKEEIGDNREILKSSVITFLKFLGGNAVQTPHIYQAYYALLANHSHADKSIQGDASAFHDDTIANTDPKSISYKGTIGSATLGDDIKIGIETITFDKCKDGFSKLMELAADCLKRPSAAEKDEQSTKFKSLVDYCAFAALLILRYTRKNVDDVNTYFWSNSEKTFSSLFAHVGFPKIVPSPVMVATMKTVLKLDSSEHKQLLAAIINSYEQTSSNSLKGVYRAGCLLALSENGLGLISWTIKAANALGPDSMQEYLARLYNRFTKDSVELAVEWYLKKDRPKAWQFCRLFDSSAMSNYSTANNGILCLISAYIALGVDEADRTMERMLQFQKFVAHMNFCRMAAEKMLLLTQKENFLQGLTPEAEMFGRSLQDYQGETGKNRLIRPRTKTQENQGTVSTANTNAAEEESEESDDDDSSEAIDMATIVNNSGNKD